MNQNKNALITGLIPALAEGLLIYFADPGAGYLVITQSMLAWFGIGFTICLTNSHSLLRVMLLTVILCSPWYIAESIGKNQPGHLLPMIAASLIMAILIFLLSRKLKSRERKAFI